MKKRTLANLEVSTLGLGCMGSSYADEALGPGIGTRCDCHEVRFDIAPYGHRGGGLNSPEHIKQVAERH
jgi:hypothetical protein